MKYTLDNLIAASLLAFLTLASPLAFAHGESKVQPLMLKELPDIPGKEAMMLTVTWPPGGGDPIHRHDSHVFVYVLEGSIVMQVKGSPAVTLKKGQTFYELPTDIHTVGRNASKTKSAKFLVLLLKDKGKAPVLPAQ